MGKVFLKMWEMENISQNPMPDADMQLDFAVNTVNPSDPGISEYSIIQCYSIRLIKKNHGNKL